MMESRSWTEQELRTLIFNEVTAGVTLQHLNESVRTLVDGTHAGFVETMGLHAETMKNLELQASRSVVQERDMKQMRDEVSRIREDSRTFVFRTEAEHNEALSKLLLEVEGLHAKQQSIVTFCRGRSSLSGHAPVTAGAGNRLVPRHPGRTSDAEGRRSRGAGPEL